VAPAVLGVEPQQPEFSEPLLFSSEPEPAQPRQCSSVSLQQPGREPRFQERRWPESHSRYPRLARDSYCSNTLPAAEKPLKPQWGKEI
jgi:hypothetical protein